MTIHFIVPGPLDRRTGGTIYDRRIIEELRLGAEAVTVHPLHGRFPMADRAAKEAAAAALASIPANATVVVDGLAVPALADLLNGHRDRAAVFAALCHHPLAAETGLSEADRSYLFDIERRGLDAADRIIVPSRHVAAMLADYGVEPERIFVVQPGLDPITGAGGESRPGTGISSPAQLLCVANLIPRKGHDVLFQALGRLMDLDWRLTCVGSAGLDSATADAVHAGGAKFGERISFAGSLSEEDLAAAYAAADLFVLPSRHEGYGMVFAEAMRSGLPVVATTAGAIPEVVPSDAGILVPPDDPDALGDAIRRVLTEGSLHRRLSLGATRHAQGLADWASAARCFREALLLRG